MIDKGTGFKYPQLQGKRIASITLPGIEGCCFPQQFSAGNEYDRMEYYCEYLGEYGIDWILCYKDGSLKAQHNARYVQTIKFEEPAKQELADDIPC